MPHGLYWSTYLGDERTGARKLDIWAVAPAECHRLLAYCDTIQEKLTPQKAERILSIKAQCWQDPSYRRTYSSTDIYTAVLEKGIIDIEGFNTYRRNSAL